MASFNPMAMLAERTCASIYNAIDTENNELAVKQADLVLRSQPDLALASALKSIALLRQGKYQDAGAICDRLVARGLRRGEEGVLSPLTWSLGRLGRRQDEIKLLEDAVKLNPNDQDLARQCFMALIRGESYQKAQQLSLKMYKAFSTPQHLAGKQGRFVDEYFWWSIQSYLLLSRDPTAAGAALALPLSQRMIEKQIAAKSLGLGDEEALWLQLQVLIKQDKHEEALHLLTQGVGATLCDRNLSLEFLRTDLGQRLSKWELVEQYNKDRIEAGSSNWAHFTAYLEAAAKLGQRKLDEASVLIKQLTSSIKSRKDRSVRLAELELLKKRTGSLAVGQQAQWTQLVIAYVNDLSTKACCHEDLLPYLACMSREERDELTTQLNDIVTSTDSESDLRTTISIAKIRRTIQNAEGMTPQTEANLSIALMQDYTAGLKVGAHLPDTEMQPADDLALLAAQAMLSAYHLSQQDFGYLIHTITLLEFALTKSKKGYQLRVLLIRCYLMYGAFDRASIHYNLMGLKSVQSDTLSHLVSDRTSCFSNVSSTTSADETLSKMVVRSLSGAQGIYEENRQSTPAMVTKAFEHGIYSRVEEFVDFGEMLDRSVQRQILRLEEARSHFANRKNATQPSFQAGMAKTVSAVTGSIKAGKLHDQRDRSVLINYQPLDTPTVDAMTQLGPQQNESWVRCMLFVLSHAAGVESTSEPTEEDKAELTEAERDLLRIVASIRSRTFKEADLLSLLDTTKAHLKATVQQSPSQGRPVDVVHTTAVLLETLYHTTAHVGNSAKTEIKAHLAEIATLINHLSRSGCTSSSSAILADGLKALGDSATSELVTTTKENLTKSYRRTLDNLKEALRSAY